MAKATKATAMRTLGTLDRLPDGRWRLTANDGSTSTLTREETRFLDRTARCAGMLPHQVMAVLCVVGMQARQRAARRAA